MARLEGLPEGVYSWLSREARVALEGIAGPHVRKKRDTVVLLASKRAGLLRDEGTDREVALSALFRDVRAVSERVWYTKWQFLPDVMRALEVCTREAQEWADAAVALEGTEFTRLRRRVLDEASLVAIKGLQLTALRTQDRADYRTDAALKLLALADPELAARARVVMEGGRGLEVEVAGLDELIEAELGKGRGEGELRVESGELRMEDGEEGGEG